MTGIERLRDIVDDGPYSGGMIHISVQKLREICEQIEREVGDISGYESDVLAFVEEKGGLDALKKRLMPEGMEWPTVDGKPVDFVTGYQPSLGVLEAVSIYSNGACEVMGHDGIIKDVKEIHVAIPKVLDADGAEIRVGDTVYQMGCKYRVSHLHGSNGKVRIVYENSGRWVDPKTLTHRAPVLAADGRPLREGETVWHVKTGREYVVVEPSYGKTVVVRLAKYDDAEGEQYAPDQLTHERPDSWERLERDANVSTCTYFGATTKDCEICGHVSWECSYDKASDLVRRAKKLAERGK